MTTAIAMTPLERHAVRVIYLIADIDLGPGRRVLTATTDGQVVIELACLRADTYTGAEGWGYSGQRVIPADWTDGQVVRCVFGLFMSYQEHEAREAFQYQGKRVFGPHISLDALVDVAERVDA